MPTAAWAGIEQIAVACDGVRISAPAIEAQICRTVADEARRRTRYPVVLGAPGADSGPPLGTSRHDLVLRVAASPGRASAIDVTLALVRRTLPRDVAAAPPTRFSVAAAQPRLLQAALRRAVGVLLAPPTARPHRPFPTPPRAY